MDDDPAVGIDLSGSWWMASSFPDKSIVPEGSEALRAMPGEGPRIPVGHRSSSQWLHRGGGGCDCGATLPLLARMALVF